MSLFNNCDKASSAFTTGGRSQCDKWILLQHLSEVPLDLVEIARADEARNFKMLLKQVDCTAAKLADPDDPRTGSYGRFLIDRCRGPKLWTTRSTTGADGLCAGTREPIIQEDFASHLGSMPIPVWEVALKCWCKSYRTQNVAGLASPIGLELFWGYSFLV
jgi:hypothetical protein